MADTIEKIDNSTIKRTSTTSALLSIKDLKEEKNVLQGQKDYLQAAKDNIVASMAEVQLKIDEKNAQIQQAKLLGVL